MSSFPTLLLFSLLIFFSLSLSKQQDIPSLDPTESNSVYLALESVNPATPWRTLYPPSDLCLSFHGVVCSLFNDTTLHVTELNLGFVSETSPNPPCSPRATFPSSLPHLPHLRKLLFYRCFTSLPAFATSFPAFDLEELVFIENPSLGGILPDFRNYPSLRILIITNSNMSGTIPEEVTKLPSLEQLTISNNPNLRGGIPGNVGELDKLRILDLSGNGLTGDIPRSVGNLVNLMKLDLSFNSLTGRIPESMGRLRKLEFLDLRSNDFGSYGVPVFLGEMGRLKEVYLSGNKLGGVIPEIWGNLRGVLRVGLSGVGLTGEIPSSMGVFLENVSYIGLDDNKLEGVVPREFGGLRWVDEVNLRNNRLSGKIPFSVEFAARVGRKLKLEGNLGLCVDKDWRIGGELKGLMTCNSTVENLDYALTVNGGSSRNVGWLFVVVGVFWSFYVGLLWVV